MLEPTGVTTDSDATFPAERFDPKAGICESAGYLGPDGERIFVYAHYPKHAAKAGIVVCPALLRDFLGNYKRDVALGRELASRDMAVCRFHHRGTGHSEGSWLTTSISRMCSDALAVARHLRDQSAGVPIGTLGTRLGAFVAAACVAPQPPQAPLVLWDPVVNAEGYLRQALRAQGIKNLREKTRETPSGSDLIRTMVETGSVDLLGYPLPHALHEEMVDVDVLDLLEGRPRPVLIVTRGPTPKDAADLGQAMEKAGFDVTFESVENGESWWFEPELLPVASEAVAAAPPPSAGPYVLTTLRWLKALEDLRREEPQ